MKPLPEYELLSRKEWLTIEEAAVLMSGVSHGTGWQAAKSILTNAIKAGKLLTSLYSSSKPSYELDNVSMENFKAFFQSINSEIEQAVAPLPEIIEKPLLKKQRKDALAVEIDTILSKTPTLTPSEVMAKLRERIGKESSCLLANIGDSIKWERDDGKLVETTSVQIESRISRWKGKYKKTL